MEVPQILIVDDEPVNRKILQAMLHSEGYKIIQAENGPSALAMVEENKPDLILLDVMMPEMDGFEVCRRLKSREDTKIIPILMVTALRDKIHREQAMESGADDFLSKPIDRVELVIRVKSLLRIKKYSDELIENYIQLRKLEQVKEGLMHMIVHDLRSPLTSISMNLELSLMKITEPLTIKQYLENSLFYCSYLDEMIQGLLDIYKMEQGAIQVNFILVDMAELILDVVKQYQPQSEARNITISVSDVEPLPKIYIDRSMIKRVLSNLIDNAIRHTPQGGFINIKGDYDDEFVKISVTNTGKSIDKKYHKRIFDKFEQLNLKKEGTNVGSCGLGLAFCKMAVELHGGSIWIEDNESQKGCTFSFKLPINNQLERG